MRSHVRVLLAAPLIGAILALVAVSAPAAQAAVWRGKVLCGELHGHTRRMCGGRDNYWAF